MRNQYSSFCPHVALGSKSLLIASRNCPAGNSTVHLISPAPHYGFPGLVPGDRWCVCAATWRQAYEAGVASPVVLEATHEETLAVIPLAALKEHALDLQ